MMTFKLHGGRMIRVRQKGLTGPLRVELLSKLSDNSDYWKTDREIVVKQAEMREFFMEKLKAAETK